MAKAQNVNAIDNVGEVVATQTQSIIVCNQFSTANLVFGEYCFEKDVEVSISAEELAQLKTNRHFQHYLSNGTLKTYTIVK